jgi:hypothetical protein
VVKNTEARLRYLVTGTFSENTEDLPELVWFEAEGQVPFGAAVGQVDRVPVGVEFY